MDRLGDQLLARAALALDQHRGVGRRDAADHLVDLLHRRRCGRSPARGAASSSPRSRSRSLRQAAQRERAVRPAAPHLFEVEGLGEVVVGAALHRLDGVRHRVLRGHDDDRACRCPPRRARDSTSRPETSGMRMSTSATSKALGAQLLQRLGCRWRRLITRVAGAAQARSRTQRIDSSSSATRMVPPAFSVPASACVSLTGRVTRKRAPPPAGARRRWCRRARRRCAGRAASPRPVPRALVVKNGREELVRIVLRHAGAVVGRR